MKLAIVASLCALLSVAVAYDTSGCKKCIQKFIELGCEKCPGDKVEACKKCVSDGTGGGKMDVSSCKGSVPSAHHDCFDLAPLLEGFDAAKLGEYPNKCMQVDVCAQMESMSEKIEEYAKKAEESAGEVKVDDSCKSGASDQGKKAMEASEALQKQLKTIHNRQSSNLCKNIMEAVKKMFGFTDEQINSAIACGSSFCPKE